MEPILKTVQLGEKESFSMCLVDEKTIVVSLSTNNGKQSYNTHITKEQLEKIAVGIELFFWEVRKNV
jgi:hypothetical protein